MIDENDDSMEKTGMGLFADFYQMKKGGT